ncbi:hypothetical protein PHYPSEUDO_012825 [Phytophthora pseudosyringae]|uniref:Uncharacterized protein n=1 Tax=Phytophthora pseudosyringae TaxID=221518 RepID=A0A8T1W9C4_9STRA|nr:hypothetical protein PHYPSEUDO_012825 [Phytophthora pseudosyringae]
MADASDDEADAMASVRMLYVMFTKLRQLAANGIPDSCARVPRLPAALAEADRPFNQTYCNRHAKVFRDNYRVNHHVFDSLVEICDAQITEPVRPTQTSSLAISLRLCCSNLRSSCCSALCRMVARCSPHKYQFGSLRRPKGLF